MILLDSRLDARVPARLTSTATRVSIPIAAFSTVHESNLCLRPRRTANSPNCCTGQYDTPATCPSSGVAYYSYFSE